MSEDALLSQQKVAPTYKNPFLWVPTSYFTMGLVYVTVGSVANIMFLNLGMPNHQAALWSSLLGAPYIFKFLWAPLLELYRTKKFFVVLMQFVLVALVAAVGLSLQLPGTSYIGPALGLMALAAIAGATQDIGSDGVYVTALPSKEQAKYTGFQSMCWNLGPILATGLLIRLSGTFHDKTGSWANAWTIIMMISAAIIFVMALIHVRTLPMGSKAPESPASFGAAMKTFGDAFVTFFKKDGIWGMIAFAFLYRLGLGLLDKQGPAFIIDKDHGLGLSNQTLGDINGIFGTGAFIVGSLLGGIFVATRGLRQSRILLVLALNIPNATFLYLSQSMTSNLYVITAIVTLEKLGWGFGAVGHMLYMMQQIAPGPYKVAHYTFATALMGLCMVVTGMVSGYIQEAVGYQTFFVIVLIAAVPSILATLFAPYPHADGTLREVKKAEAEPKPAAAL
jgi:PAT family beta-lactamase induction signal transducer AmpG